MRNTAALVSDPTLIFFIVLAIILLAPLLLNRLKIPHIIGMIVAGVIVGPHGFYVLDNDASFEIFGQVGLLYLMFLAAIEIDLFHLQRNLKRGATFGLLTFGVPLVFGFLSAIYILHTDLVTALLLAAMYAAHTLISYPVAVRFGITKAPAVLMAIVGTIVAVIGALLTLATAVNVHQTGYFSLPEILLLLGKLLAFCLGVNLVYRKIARRFMRCYTDRVTQFVFVLALVFFAAWAARAIGLESVLGAFFAGLVLNRFVPNASPLMARLEFVGNALFIPYFLIGVGMMIDVRVISSTETLQVAGIMLAVALASKWLAAWVAAKIYGMDGSDCHVMFGLTTAHTAVALAVVSVGYNFGLMDHTMLNGTILMILTTCAIAPMATSGAAARIKIRMLEEAPAHESGERADMTLVPVNNPVTSLALMELALFVHPAGRERSNLMAVHVRTDNSQAARNNCEASLKLAQEAAAAVDVPLECIDRFDSDIATGLLNLINERDVNCVVMGLHRKNSLVDTFFGRKMERIIQGTSRMLMICRFFNPVNTLRRLVVYIPPKAEYESGFRLWMASLGRLARNLGCVMTFMCHPQLRRVINGVLKLERLEVRTDFMNMEDWDDFVVLSNRIADDDLLAIVSARPGSLSYGEDVKEMPAFLQKYFTQTNLMVIYPEQNGKPEESMSFIDPTGSEIINAPAWPRMLGGVFGGRFHRRRRRRIPPQNTAETTP